MPGIPFAYSIGHNVRYLIRYHIITSGCGLVADSPFRLFPIMVSHVRTLHSFLQYYHANYHCNRYAYQYP